MRWTLDRSLLLVVFFLIGLGLVQVYSASYIYAIEVRGDGLHFFLRQLLFAGLGVLVIFLMAYLPWNWLERWGWTFWLLSSLLVALTLVPGLGVRAGGAVRWLKLPFIQQFEPGELLKVGYPLLFATFLANRMPNWRPWMWAVVLVGSLLPLALLLRQPDFGTFAICILMLVGMWFAFGMSWKLVAAGALSAIPIFYLLVYRVPYRWARVEGFLDPWAAPEQSGFQVIQSLLSFHAGGAFGVGLGQGQGKLFFLPEAHNDFTLAVLGEELGFIGFFFVMLIFGFLVFRGLQITVRARAKFAQALALGLTLFLAFSIFINVSVGLGLLPTKGLTLPFLSYGGSSLVSTCIAIGLLLNIERQGRRSVGRPFLGYRIAAEDG